MEVQKVKQNRKLIQTFYVIVITLLLTNIINPVTIKAASLDVDAESAIVVDAETGKVLFAKNPDISLPPASMTKMMTEYLVWEAIESGQISWDTTSQISDYNYLISLNSAFFLVGQ